MKKLEETLGKLQQKYKIEEADIKNLAETIGYFVAECGGTVPQQNEGGVDGEQEPAEEVPAGDEAGEFDYIQ